MIVLPLNWHKLTCIILTKTLSTFFRTELIGKIVHLRNSNFELSLGWSKESIDKGVEEMKLPKISSGIITNGPIDLVHYHYEKSNNLLGMTIFFVS